VAYSTLLRKMKSLTTILFSLCFLAIIQAQSIQEREDYHPKWSSDGTRIVYYSRSPNSGIYVINRDGSFNHKVGNVFGFHPIFSPDGEWIVFCRSVQGKVKLYQMKPDGSDLQLLYEHPNGNIFHPDFSADGNWLAFDVDTGGQDDVYLYEFQTSVAQQLTQGIMAATPTFSADGQKIAFTGQVNADAPADIYTINTDGTGLTQLTDSPANDLMPDWSPEDDRLVFVSGIDGQLDLHFMNTDGTGFQRFNPTRMNEFFPRWSPDGQYIAYTAAGQDVGILMLLKLETGKIIPVKGWD